MTLQFRPTTWGFRRDHRFAVRCLLDDAQLANFELPFLDLLRRFDTTDHNVCRLKALNPYMGRSRLLDPSMILLDSF
jgi:hypothetical protein